MKKIYAVQSIGVNYGTIADDLPPATEVIALYKISGIGKMRIFDPNQATLQALKGSNISVIVGVVNNDLQGLATSPGAANGRVQTNISPYLPDVNISYIAVGNEIKPSSFSDNASAYINAIASFLVSTKAPLLANVYPYFAYLSDPTDVKLDYALLNSSGVVVQDGNLGYQNFFDAMMDSLYSALEKIGAGNLTVIVTETGWPSDSGVAATVDNAGTYYKNLISHVNNGTPKRPEPLETYLFAPFNEDQKDQIKTLRKQIKELKKRLFESKENSIR
ncbi:glucan endo-1 [Quercus suber]|uniref:glucan endo-1,3-beta-D-glucosidase n=1 Tax=Quercus suber TaxID=58331 RepID=A0AAW0L9M5_QUESU